MGTWVGCDRLTHSDGKWGQTFEWVVLEFSSTSFSFLGAFFLFQVLGNFNWPQFGLIYPTIPQWWHVGRLLSVECLDFADVVLSFSQETIIALPLSFWGSELEGFTKTVLEVEAMMEELVATYPRPVLSDEHFWPVSIWASLLSETFLLVCNWLHSVGQNHFYVMMLLNRDSTI
jgi:hypothetical protein